MKDLLIYGCGSVGRMIEQIVYDINQNKETWNIIGFIDDDTSKIGLGILGYPVFSRKKMVSKYSGTSIIIGVAASRQREIIRNELIAIGITNFATIIHPTAWLSRNVEIGEGSIIYPGVYMDVDVKIGCHNIFNKLCTIGHGGSFGDFVTVAPGVNFGGDIYIGKGCEFGINSATLQGIVIGEWAVIGAGATVIKDLPANCTAVGTPARPLKRNKLP